MKRYFWLCVAVLSITACAHYTLVQPQRRTVGDLYTVEPQRAWNRSLEGKVEVWTVDGPLLEAVRFISGLEDGQTLIDVGGKDPKMPRFRAHMTATEVLEFFVGSVRSIAGDTDTAMIARGWVPSAGVRAANINASTLEVTNLRPARFGELSGFRFNIDFLSREGLERAGMVIGTIHEEKLYLIVYTAAREYYFPRYKADVEQMFASIRVKS
jgi:hypothetical protein